MVALLLACGTALLTACDNKPTPTTASPTPNPRLIYELREKCGKDASDWFKREHGDQVDAVPTIVTVQNEYTNHYNEHLNRCYAIVLNAHLISSAQHKIHSIKSASLVDVNENHEVGTYFINSESTTPLKCSVDDHQCGSIDEWQQLSAPYMNQ